jgi:hypothetical protein
VTGLLGLLATSAILTIVGTAIRGLLRPVLWGLGLTAALFALSSFLRSSPRPNEEIPPLSGNSSPILGTSPRANNNAPFAVEGLRDAAEDLRPTIDRILPSPTIVPTPLDDQFPQDLQPQPSPIQPQPQPQPPPTTDQQPSNTQPPRQTISPAPAQSPSPIQGFW